MNVAQGGLNTDAILADVGGMTAQEVGAYLLLVLHYEAHGELFLEDVDTIARIKGKQWNRVWNSVERLFYIESVCYLDYLGHADERISMTPKRLSEYLKDVDWE